MKVSALKESKYIKKEDCPLDLTIKSITEENIGLEGDQEMRYVMHFSDHDKGLILNITNGEIMAENFGTDEMNDWIGRRVSLYNDRNVMYAGKRVGGVRVKSNVTEPSVEEVNKDMQAAKEANDDEVPF